MSSPVLVVVVVLVSESVLASSSAVAACVRCLPQLFVFKSESTNWVTDMLFDWLLAVLVLVLGFLLLSNADL